MHTDTGEYHALLARHDAMRLRQQLLSPGQATGAAGRAPSAYDGAADQRTITRGLPLVTPFEDLISLLYQALFERHPYLRSLFPASMEFQQAHLARAFWYLIEHLDRPDEITATFTQLGRDHRKLGVRPAHYEAFETALCEALRHQAGRHWSPALEQAWLRMLRLAVTAMVQGAEAALNEPPCWEATVTSRELRTPHLAVLRARPHEPFPHRAGQYAAVESPRLPHAWRPYYLAGAPHADDELEIHVRFAGPGGVSEALVHRTQAGDVLRLGPARGSMTLDDAPTNDVLLVASGTGWAPMKALLQQLDTRRGRGSRVRLFLGARTAHELYDTAYLTDFERRRPWLSTVPVLGGGEGPKAGAYGQMADAVIRHGSLSGCLALIGGPPEMVRTVADRLAQAGMPADRVRHDPLPALPQDVGTCGTGRSR